MVCGQMAQEADVKAEDPEGQAVAEAVAEAELKLKAGLRTR